MVVNGGAQAPQVTYTGLVQSVELTSGGKRLRVFVSREGRANDVLMYPPDAQLAAGDVISPIVRPAVERDGQGRLLDAVVYWVDPVA